MERIKKERKKLWQEMNKKEALTKKERKKKKEKRWGYEKKGDK